MSIRVRICLVSMAALVLQSRGARAEERVTEGTSSRLESPRALNSHVFQPSRLITGPFSTTAFGSVTAFGAGDADAPRYDIRGNQIGTRKYTLGAFGLGFNTDLRLTPDIALRFEVTGSVFSGTTGRGLLVAGATAQYGFTAGVTAGRDLGRDMRLAFVADFGLEPQFSLLVGNAVRGAVLKGNFDDTGLFSQVERIKAAPGVSFAWAPAPWFGLVAEGRFIWSRRVTTGDQTLGDRTGQGVSLGALASFDVEPLLRWPFAFQAGWRSDLPVGNDGIAGVRQASLGVYYSRRVRLALGLETIWRHGAIRPGVEPTLHGDSAIGNIVFRYYW
jgi:hypothetical protein